MSRRSIQFGMPNSIEMFSDKHGNGPIFQADYKPFGCEEWWKMAKTGVVRHPLSDTVCYWNAGFHAQMLRRVARAGHKGY